MNSRIEWEERGMQGQSPNSLPPIHPRRSRKKWVTLLIIGVILLIIGMAVAVQPTTWTWKNMRSISEEPGGFGYTIEDGSVVEAHYKSYEMGDTVMVSGEITNKSEVIFPSVEDRGYKYNYVLDGISDELITSKEDIGEKGDKVYLKIEFRVFTDGFFIYSLWSVESKIDPSPALWYGGGVLLWIMGVSLIGIGAWKRKESKRRIAQAQPSPYQPLQALQYQPPPATPAQQQIPAGTPSSSPPALIPIQEPTQEATSVAGQKRYCAFCSAELPPQGTFCTSCGKKQSVEEAGKEEGKRPVQQPKVQPPPPPQQYPYQIQQPQYQYQQYPQQSQIQYYPQYPSIQETNTVGLVLGILSIMLCWAYGIGIVLGIIGYIKSKPKKVSGVEFGNAGYMLSIVGIILGALILAIVIIAVLYVLVMPPS